MCELCGITDIFESDTVGAAGGLVCMRVFTDTQQRGCFLVGLWHRHPHPGCTVRLHVEAERVRAENGDTDFKLNC